MGAKLATDESLLNAKFHPHRCKDKGTGPSKLKFLLRFCHNWDYKLEMCMGMGFPFPWDSHGNPMGTGTQICQKWEREWEEYT